MNAYLSILNFIYEKNLSFDFRFGRLLFQCTERFPKNQLHGSIGYSTHGTNDLLGTTIGAGYVRNFARHFFWTAGLEGTMHSGRVAALQGVQGGERMDNSVWDVEAGAEGFGGFGWAFIRTPEHDLSIQLNGILRYQYASIGYNGY